MGARTSRAHVPVSGFTAQTRPRPPPAGASSAMWRRTAAGRRRMEPPATMGARALSAEPAPSMPPASASPLPKLPAAVDGQGHDPGGTTAASPRASAACTSDKPGPRPRTCGAADIWPAAVGLRVGANKKGGDTGGGEVAVHGVCRRWPVVLRSRSGDSTHGECRRKYFCACVRICTSVREGTRT